MTARLDDNRCARCGWPLAESAERGCVRGNCDYRPVRLERHEYYDAERWDRETSSTPQAIQGDAAPLRDLVREAWLEGFCCADPEGGVKCEVYWERSDIYQKLQSLPTNHAGREG